MTSLPESARELLESAALAHIVTINDDGSPQVSCVWVGLDGDEIVAAHLDPEQRKLRNLRRDPRVSLSVEGSGANAVGMRDYLTIHGRARLEQGGAPELLQRLARTYVGPEARFPPSTTRRRAWSRASPLSASAVTALGPNGDRARRRA